MSLGRPAGCSTCRKQKVQVKKRGRLWGNWNSAAGEEWYMPQKETLISLSRPAGCSACHKKGAAGYVKAAVVIGNVRSLWMPKVKIPWAGPPAAATVSNKQIRLSRKRSSWLQKRGACRSRCP